MNRATAVTKAASIKTSVDAVEAAFQASDFETAAAEFARLHAKLNGLAHRAADFFGGEVSEFSGGTDKPEE